MSKSEAPDPDDPIEYFIEEKQINSMDETIRNYRTALGHLQEFLDEEGLEPGELKEREAKRFVGDLEDQVAGRTANDYAIAVSEFYGFFSKRGTFETNPVSLVLDDWDFDIEHKEQREIPIEAVREILRNEHLPRRILIFTIIPKTGIRIGELHAMNLEDVHLDHPAAQEYMPDPRYEIENEPDTLYIPPVLGGDKRNAGTHVPIDDELKQALLYWLSVYQPTPPGEDDRPLIQNTSGGNTGLLGSRPSKKHIREIVRDTAKRYGWYEEGAGYYENMNPHSFRHFFSTYAAHEGHGGEMDEDVIKYIRGDTGHVSTLDEYQHFWDTSTRLEYLNNIFKLFE